MAADAPLATYPVRSAPGYWFAVYMLILLGTLGGGALLFVITTTTDGTHGNWTFLVVAALALLAPIGYWFGSAAYRIGHGKSLIRFYDDRLEVPPARRGPMLVFPRSELTVTSTEMRARYRIGGITAATVRRGYLLVFRAGARSRHLSTLTIQHPKAFLEDLKLFLDGVPPIGPEKWAEVSSARPPRTADDDRLDAELAKVD